MAKKKTRYKLGDCFPCKCGNTILLDGVWLAAHWQERLTTKCSRCGQQWETQAGKVKKA